MTNLSVVFQGLLAHRGRWRRALAGVAFCRLWLGGGLLVPVAARPADDAAAVQRERLEKYSFVRTTYDAGAIGLLIGNTELGGMADAAGLALPRVWGADLWQHEAKRRSVEGFGLQCDEFGGTNQPTAYRQALGLADGVIRTRALYGGDNGYEAELFCSLADRHLVVLRVKNLGGKGARTWRVVRPLANCAATEPAPGVMAGQDTKPDFTRDAWALRASKPWASGPAGQLLVSLQPGEAVTLLYACTTSWDGADYVPLSLKTVSGRKMDYERVARNHGRAWAALWEQSATLALPDEALERMWYRALFATLITCGSERFLPGESMFAVDCWDMRPFTYGAGGWAVQALASAGFPERARAMLDWHFQPEMLPQNADFYTRRLAGKPAGPLAWSFGHELKAHGRNNPCDFWELQRHVDGFAAALFYRFNRLYPDAAYFRQKVYPVLRGVACFYQGLAQLDAPTGQYILPRMTSLTEDLSAVNPIDAALAAQWCLMEAARASEELNVDPELRAGWKTLAGKLCIPQNATRYLEYFGDKEQRAGGGYQGIRGFVYLSYPTLELKPLLDHDKVVRTLDYTWERNNHGDGMISFVANWFALADTHYGRGEHALAVMRHDLKCLDRWNTSLRETPDNANYYFTTGYTSFILVPLSMALQSSAGRIAAFPAVPKEWKDFAFYNIPAESGVRVSGQMKDGQIQWVSYNLGRRELLRRNQGGTVLIRQEGKSVRLTPES